MAFLPQRPRRLRQYENIRKLVRETRFTTDNFIYPLFIAEGKKIKKPIPSMPGVFQFSPDLLSAEIKEITSLGIGSVLLFGIPKKKDAVGSGAYQKKGIISQAINTIKGINNRLTVITDVCFCEYTDHGHCGIIKNGTLDNDATLTLLSKEALTHVRAGADMVAPSGMIDGMVGVIRKSLDKNHFENIPILSYSVKYASSFYGPFRDAADCAPKFGDRKSYQMDPPNWKEALREVDLDLREGADMIMVKPALCYLDIIRLIKDRYNCPLAAYNVSGEYAMVKAAAANGWMDEKKVMLEMLTSIKRAGADIIITYFAKDAAKLLNA